MRVGCIISERRDQGEALAKCLRAGLGKSRSLRLTAIFLSVRWSEDTRCLDDPPHPSLTSGDFFASIGACIKNHVFVYEASFTPSHA